MEEDSDLDDDLMLLAGRGNADAGPSSGSRKRRSNAVLSDDDDDEDDVGGGGGGRQKRQSRKRAVRSHFFFFCVFCIFCTALHHNMERITVPCVTLSFQPLSAYFLTRAGIIWGGGASKAVHMRGSTFRGACRLRRGGARAIFFFAS